MHFLGLGAGGRLPGADGPNGLVCNNYHFCLIGRKMKQRFFQLQFHKLILGSRLAYGQRLTTTKNGSYKMLEAKIQFLREHCVSFMKVLPSFAVPDNTIGNGERMQHFCRHFTCKRAVFFVITILSAYIVVGFFFNFAPCHQQVRKRHSKYCVSM